MARLTRNAVRCLRCGGIAESRHRHDFVWCPCGAIAADGGHAYERLYGAALSDASYEPLHEYDDGGTRAGSQFVPLLNGHLPWNGGDGRALHRLIAALRSGTAPDPAWLSPSGRRRLGYLAEVALSLSPEPGPAAALRDLVATLRQTVGEERYPKDTSDPHWLPDHIAGADDRAWSWGLGVGLSDEFRQTLAS